MLQLYLFRQSRATPKPGRSSGSSSWQNKTSPRRVLHDRNSWARSAKIFSKSKCYSFSIPPAILMIWIWEKSCEKDSGSKEGVLGCGEAWWRRVHACDWKQINCETMLLDAFSSAFSPCVCQVCKKNDSFKTFKPLHQEKHDGFSGRTFQVDKDPCLVTMKSQIVYSK